MKTTVTIIAAAAAISFCACSSGGGGQRSAERGTIEFESIQYQASNELSGSAGDFFRDADVVYTDSITMVLPRTIYGKDMTALRDSVVRMALDTLGTNVDSLINGFVQRDARQFTYPIKPVAPVSITQADGFNYINASVVNLTPSLVVYMVASSIYEPGAANGLTTHFYINYDLDSMKVLDGKYMFLPDKRKELSSIIASRAGEMTEIIGPTQIDSLPDGDNFWINPDGEIVFVYQPFEVASHAQGLISIEFYPYELFDCLTPEAVKYFNLGDLE